MRATTGASVVAILPDGRPIPNLKSPTVFQPGDRVGFIGEDRQVAAATERL